MSDGRSWEERYLEDLLPVIEDYAAEETTGFTSQDIADRLEGYSPQMVGKTLKYVTEKDETRHIIYTGNNPKTWEAVLLDGVAWERVETRLDVQPQKEEVDVSEAAKRVLKEYPEQDYDELRRVFMSRIKSSGASTAQKISEMSQSIEENRPEVSRDIMDFDPALYGKMHKYIDTVYDELKDMSEVRSGFFNSEEIGERLEDVPKEAAGIVLKGLKKADLLEGYEDRKGYFPESIDVEEIREFSRVVRNSESLEELRDKIEWKDD